MKIKFPRLIQTAPDSDEFVIEGGRFVTIEDMPQDVRCAGGCNVVASVQDSPWAEVEQSRGQRAYFCPACCESRKGAARQS